MDSEQTEFVFKNNARVNVLKEIDFERDQQDHKWGPQNHAPAHWLMILGEEVGEANKAALEDHFKKYYAPHTGTDNGCSVNLIEYRKELVQVAAVAVAMIESLDRNELKMLRKFGDV